MQYSKMGGLCRIYSKVGIHNVLSHCIADLISGSLCKGLCHFSYDTRPWEGLLICSIAIGDSRGEIAQQKSLTYRVLEFILKI